MGAEWGVRSGERVVVAGGLWLENEPSKYALNHTQRCAALKHPCQSASRGFITWVNARAEKFRG